MPRGRRRDAGGARSNLLAIDRGRLANPGPGRLGQRLRAAYHRLVGTPARPDPPSSGRADACSATFSLASPSRARSFCCWRPSSCGRLPRRRRSTGRWREAGDHAGGARLQIRIAFAEDMTERELRALLTSVGGTLVSGPSALGIYTVRHRAVFRCPGGGARDAARPRQGSPGRALTRLVMASLGPLPREILACAIALLAVLAPGCATTSPGTAARAAEGDALPKQLVERVVVVTLAPASSGSSDRITAELAGAHGLRACRRISADVDRRPLRGVRGSGEPHHGRGRAEPGR